MGKANITIYHPKKDGGGSAVRVDMHYQTETVPGFIRFTFANQNGTAYDFNSGIECDLKFKEISEVLNVIHGDAEVIEGGGVMRVSDDTFFAMKKDESGFVIGACRKDGDRIEKSQMTLKAAEAAGLCGVLESSLFFVAFIKGVNP